MKRVLRGFLIACICVAVLFVVYLVFDCIRMLNAASEEKPIYTVSESISEEKHTYTGLGYTVTYEFTETESLIGGQVVTKKELASGEYKLFGILKIWAWIR